MLYTEQYYDSDIDDEIEYKIDVCNIQNAIITQGMLYCSKEG